MPPDRTGKKVRALIRAVARLLDQEENRVNARMMLDLCHEAAPGSIGMTLVLKKLIAHKLTFTTISAGTGGELFEHWLDSRASETSHKQWNKICSLHSKGFYIDPENEEVQQIVDRERTKFHGFVIKAVCDMGNLGKKQMFFTTLAAQFHGISRMGIDMQAQYGFMMPTTSFDRMRSVCVDQARERTRSKSCPVHATAERSK